MNELDPQISENLSTDQTSVEYIGCATNKDGEDQFIVAEADVPYIGKAVELRKLQVAEQIADSDVASAILDKVVGFADQHGRKFVSATVDDVAALDVIHNAAGSTATVRSLHLPSKLYPSVTNYDEAKLVITDYRDHKSKSESVTNNPATYEGTRDGLVRVHVNVHDYINMRKQQKTQEALSQTD